MPSQPIGQQAFQVKLKVKGTISSKGMVRVMSGGSVEGQVNGQTVRVDGEINGKVQASERVIFVQGSRFRGEVTASELEMDAGANFQARCRIGLDTLPEVSSPLPLPEPENREWFWQQ